MSWVAIEVNTAPESRVRLGAWLVEQTGHAIEERDDGTLVAYAGTTEAAGMLDRALRGFAESPVTVVHRVLPEVDWSTSWRDGIIVRRFGRLTLSPTWLADTTGSGPRVILDPESAFGSGEHGSTRAALTLLDRHVKPKDRVLDLGSGSGILSIGAVKLGAAWAVGVEVDEESIPVAERNAESNGVTDQVQFIHGDAADVAPLFAPVDLVLSNILRVVNVALLPEIIASLRPGGIAIFSGMEEPEEPLFLPELSALGLTVVDEARDAGWWAGEERRGVAQVLIPPGSAGAGGPVLLDDDEQHHLKVRRIPAGSDVAFTDGAGVRGAGHLVSQGRGLALAVESLEQVPAPAPIMLGVGAGDRDRFGWLVEKATELGVTEIVPLETERTRGVATGLKPEQVDKLRRRAREVLKQCGGAWVPVLRDSQPLGAFVASAPVGARWLLDAAGGAAPALDAESPAAALVGPEGGLSDAERAAALVHGFTPIMAGPLTLRFETAAVAAAVLIQASRHR